MYLIKFQNNNTCTLIIFIKNYPFDFLGWNITYLTRCCANDRIIAASCCGSVDLEMSFPPIWRKMTFGFHRAISSTHWYMSCTRPPDFPVIKASTILLTCKLNNLANNNVNLLFILGLNFTLTSHYKYYLHPSLYP